MQKALVAYPLDRGTSTQLILANQVGEAGDSFMCVLVCMERQHEHWMRLYQGPIGLPIYMSGKLLGSHLINPVDVPPMWQLRLSNDELRSIHLHRKTAQVRVGSRQFLRCGCANVRLVTTNHERQVAWQPAQKAC